MRHASAVTVMLYGYFSANVPMEVTVCGIWCAILAKKSIDVLFAVRELVTSISIQIQMQAQGSVLAVRILKLTVLQLVLTPM